MQNNLQDVKELGIETQNLHIRFVVFLILFAEHIRHFESIGAVLAVWKVCPSWITMWSTRCCKDFQILFSIW